MPEDKYAIEFTYRELGVLNLALANSLDDPEIEESLFPRKIDRKAVNRAHNKIEKLRWKLHSMIAKGLI